MTLSWQVTNADAVEIDGIGTVDTSGSVQRAVRDSVTFTLKATNKGIHPISRAISIVVVSPTSTPAPTAAVAAPPTATVPSAATAATAPAPPTATSAPPAVAVNGGSGANPPAANGSKPWSALAVTSAGGNDVLWSANAADGVVRRVAVQSRTQSLIPVGKGPASLLVTASAVWVANQGDNTVQPVDPQTNRAGQAIPVGKAPSSLAVEQTGSGRTLIWVANSGEATVQAIDDQSGKVVATAAVATEPGSVAAGTGQIWVLNQATGNLQGVRVTG